MAESFSRSCTAFDGTRLLASGPLVEVALAVKRALDGGAAGPVLAFDDTTGRVIDLDLRGSTGDVVGRLSAESGPARTGAAPAPPRGRGRPKLGVVAREVTLLPRHWEWLETQSGGASAALRRLVDGARRAGGDESRRRAARQTAYHFMVAIAGDLPGFEEGTRALFAGDRARFERQTAAWPADVRAHALRLGFPDPGPAPAGGVSG